jgi:hypothetical protein
VSGVQIGATEPVRRGYPAQRHRRGHRRPPGARQRCVATRPGRSSSSTTAALLARLRRKRGTRSGWRCSTARVGATRSCTRWNGGSATGAASSSSARPPRTPSRPAAPASSSPRPYRPRRGIARPGPRAACCRLHPDPKAKDLAPSAVPGHVPLGCPTVITGTTPTGRAFRALRGARSRWTELAGMLTPTISRACLTGPGLPPAPPGGRIRPGAAQARSRCCAVVCAPAGGPFPGLAIARDLAPRFVAPDCRRSRSPPHQAALGAGGRTGCLSGNPP